MSQCYVTYGYLRYEGRVFRILSPSILHQQEKSYPLQLKSKSYVFRKLQNLVSRQAQAAAFKETANTQLSLDDKQPEQTLFCSPRSLPTADKVPATFVTNKGRRRKREVCERERDKVLVTAAIDKSCKMRRQNPEIQDHPDSFELMLNYFDKRLDGIEKKVRQPLKESSKIEDPFKFRHKGNRVQFEFNNQILQIVLQIEIL